MTDRDVEECCGPPVLFDVSVHCDNDVAKFETVHISVGTDNAVQRVALTVVPVGGFCSTCSIQRKTFVCGRCTALRTHTRKGVTCNLIKLDTHRKNLIEQTFATLLELQPFLDARVENAQYRSDVIETENRIGLLKSCIQRKQLQVVSKQLKLEKLDAQRKRLSQRSEAYQRVILDLQQSDAKWLKHIAEKRPELSARLTAAIRKRQAVLQNVFEDLFPVEASRANNTLDDVFDNTPLVSALADAALATFVNGQWVVAGGCLTDLKLRILRSTMADADNFDVLKNWIFLTNGNENRELQLSNSPRSFSQVRQALSGLAYASQLTLVIAAIVDFPLPFKVSYADFCCLANLTENIFDTNVVMLKANIALLCFSQGLTEQVVELSSPIYNLINFFSYIRNMRALYGPFAPSNKFWSTFEASIKGVTKWTERSSEMSTFGINQFEQQQNSGDDDSFADDWEKITDIPAVDAAEMSESTFGEATNANLSTVFGTPTGGGHLNNLFASATHSITNLFRTVGGATSPPTFKH